MKFSVGVEYALHSLVYMIDLDDEKCIGIRDLASFQGVTETYLSKVFAKLVKFNIVKSGPGVKGGYALNMDARRITFWDVIEAVEGTQPWFQCKEIKKNALIVKDENAEGFYDRSSCLICSIMNEGQETMKKFFETKTIYDLYDEIFNHQFSEDQKRTTIEWFKSHSW